MNFYKYPSEQAEVVLAHVWAKSAKSEGHRKAFPKSPQVNPGGKAVVTESDKEAVMKSLDTGRSFIGEVARHTGFGCKVASRVLAALVEDGKVKKSITQRKRNDSNGMLTFATFSIVQVES